MSAIEAIRSGQLQDALRDLQQEVRRQPAEAKHRVFLFQLLAVLGEWERALVQLNVAGELDSANTEMMHAYREVLQCEALREDVFAGNTTPLIFGEPAAWIARMAEALRLDSMRDFESAAQVRAAALEEAPAVAGSIDGQRFAWIADGDSRLGPQLEVIVNGRYYWAPFARIKSIAVEAPADLRDRVWTPVRVTWTTGGETVAFVPTRYAGATAITDPALQMARLTEWSEAAPGMYFGRGQRMFATDLGDHALMDVRLLEFDQPEA